MGFFDVQQFDRALQQQAMPALERLTDPTQRERALRRFERDEPPQYASSTEGEDDDEPAMTVEEADRLLEAPLDSRERHLVMYFVSGDYGPARRYADELRLEEERLHDWAQLKAGQKLRDYFWQKGLARKDRAGAERRNVVARHCVKRRWQKLGVWNPTWGIPGRQSHPQLGDDCARWQWSWQHDGSGEEWLLFTDLLAKNPRHPVPRLVAAREGVTRHQRCTPPPQPHLPDGASAAQGESFIVSRPWFMYDLEVTEEGERQARIPVRETARFGQVPQACVSERWEKNGHWRTSWPQENDPDRLVGWKWRHESPSPEPEDFTGNESLSDFDLTSSEIDALDAVRPPSPPTPAYDGPVSKDTSVWTAPLPGQPPVRTVLPRLLGSPPELVSPCRLSPSTCSEFEGLVYPPSSIQRATFVPQSPAPPLPKPTSPSHPTTPVQLVAHEQPASPPPADPMRRRREQSRSPPPTLRRSARIAALTAKRALQAPTSPRYQQKLERRQQRRRTFRKGLPSPPAEDENPGPKTRRPRNQDRCQ